MYRLQVEQKKKDDEHAAEEKAKAVAAAKELEEETKAKEKLEKVKDEPVSSSNAETKPVVGMFGAPPASSAPAFGSTPNGNPFGGTAAKPGGMFGFKLGGGGKRKQRRVDGI